MRSVIYLSTFCVLPVTIGKLGHSSIVALNCVQIENIIQYKYNGCSSLLVASNGLFPSIV